MSRVVHKGSEDEGGFILLDALIASVILGLAATTIVTIGTGVLTRQEDELDRIEAVTRLDVVAEEIALRGYNPNAPFSIPDDGQLSYSVVEEEPASEEAQFVPLRLIARSLSDPDRELASLLILAKSEEQPDVL